MHLLAALIYWPIVGLWSVVLGTIVVFYLRNPRSFGTTRLLLAVLGIDTLRNIIENCYFGLFFGSHYGLFPGAIATLLGNPLLLIVPKLLNIASGCLVLGLLLLRWLPLTIAERAKSERRAEQLLEMTEVDGMTGLSNRSHFLDVAELERARSQRYDRPLSLLMVDIDHFKSINDGYGHDVGDRVVAEVAGILRGGKRTSDVAGRLGGDEFAVLLPETPLREAWTVAERMRQAISTRSIRIAGGEVRLTVSVGASELGPQSSLAELLKQADTALYQAKRQGRNRACTFGAPTEGVGGMAAVA